MSRCLYILVVASIRISALWLPDQPSLGGHLQPNQFWVIHRKYTSLEMASEGETRAETMGLGTETVG